MLEIYVNCAKFPTIWDGNSLDWQDNATPESICKRVTSKVKNGSIVIRTNIKPTKTLIVLRLRNVLIYDTINLSISFLYSGD